MLPTIHQPPGFALIEQPKRKRRLINDFVPARPAGPVRVILDRTGRLCLPVDVRFSPKATEALLRSEMTRWAKSESRTILLNHLVGRSAKRREKSLLI
jgi:hypothetical protein